MLESVEKIRELVSSYRIEEMVMNLRQHDRLKVSMQSPEGHFDSTITSGHEGVSLLVSAQSEEDWARFEVLVMARHAPRLVGNAIGIGHFSTLFREPACSLVYTAESATESTMPAHLQKHVRPGDFWGSHLRAGEAYMHEWIIPLDHAQDVEVEGARAALLTAECVIRFDQNESFGKLWRGRAELRGSEGVQTLDLFHEDEDAYSPRIRRKNGLKSWSQVERRHQVFEESFESGPHKVAVVLERIV